MKHIRTHRDSTFPNYESPALTAELQALKIKATARLGGVDGIGKHRHLGAVGEASHPVPAAALQNPGNLNAITTKRTNPLRKK